MEKWTRLLTVLATWLSLLAVLAVLIRLAVVVQHTVLLFSVAALLAYALDPVVEFIRRQPFPFLRRHNISLSRPAAVGVVFLLLLALASGAIAGLYRPAMHQIRLISDKGWLARNKLQAENFLHTTDDRLAHMGFHSQLATYAAHPSSLPANVQTAAAEAERTVVGFLREVAVTVGETLIVLLISIYLLIYSQEMRIRFNRMLPASLLPHAVVWEEDVNRILGGFVRGQLIIAMVLGVAAAAGCFLIGIRLWLLIGVFVVGAALIPVFGPYLGAAPAILLALLTPTHFANRVVAAIVMLLLFIAINEGGSKILYPKLVGRAIGLHEVLVLFVLFAGLEIGGVPGVLFAAPLTAIGFATVVHLYRFWQDLPDSLVFRGTDDPQAETNLPGDRTGVPVDSMPLLQTARLDP